MTEATTINTDLDGLVLRELVEPSDDVALFELVKANRDFWKQYDSDIVATHSTLEDVMGGRLDAEDESELRLGIWNRDALIGWLSVMDYCNQPEIGNWLGIWLDEHSTGKGYATIALESVISYVRDSRPNNTSFATTTDHNNTGAKKVLERMGFIPHPEERLPFQRASHLVYRLTSETE